jgi:multiple sugar transport system substrate-binding protein
MSRSKKFNLSPSPKQVGIPLLDNGMSRRDLLKYAGAVGGAGLVASSGLTACGSSAAPGTITFESNQSDAVPKKALADLVTKYMSQSSNKINISTIDHNTFQNNLANYLNAKTPPDMLTWFAGNRVRFFAGKGLLAEVTDAFDAVPGYTPVLKSLSSLSGKVYFMPTDYYWWGVFYNKAVWAQKGYTEPKTWDEWIALCKQMQKDGLNPIAFADADGWPAGGWFDFINLRMNGYDFHIRLMAGQEKFTDPKVHAVFDKWAEILPYTTPQATAYKWQDQVGPIEKGTAGMYMLGAFLVQSATTLKQDDFDFFAFPQIDPSIPMSTEAPTDGWIFSSRSKQLSVAKDFAKWSVQPDNDLTYSNALGGVIPVNSQATAPTDPFIAKGAKLLADSTGGLSQFFDRDSSPAFSQNGLGSIQGFLNNPKDITSVQNALQQAMDSAANS